MDESRVAFVRKLSRTLSETRKVRCSLGVSHPHEGEAGTVILNSDCDLSSAVSGFLHITTLPS